MKLAMAVILGVTWAKMSWENMDRLQKTMMKSAIAENIIQSTHMSDVTAGPNIGSLRNHPGHLTRQQICLDIPDVQMKNGNNVNDRADQVKRKITIQTMKAVMDGSYQEWIDHLTQDTYPEPKK
jgi:hypothetical protein